MLQLLPVETRYQMPSSFLGTPSVHFICHYFILPNWQGQSKPAVTQGIVYFPLVLDIYPLWFNIFNDLIKNRATTTKMREKSRKENQKKNQKKKKKKHPRRNPKRKKKRKKKKKNQLQKEEGVVDVVEGVVEVVEVVVGVVDQEN